ncbi:MAG: integrase family protein [Burkholderiales bacterium]|nr:integrase family protein [Burkholderiales bacterium]MBS0415392.1 integrase family protein [Pseudomonadota bacterium]
MAKVQFTAGRVRDFVCPPDKKQAFLWDTAVPGLGLRSTPAGKPAYIFQGRHAGKTVRATIGNPSAWTIEQARTKARELQRLIDEGTDPRTPKREAIAAALVQAETHVAQAAQAARDALRMDEAWAAYIVDRTPHWGERHARDHAVLARASGEPFSGTRGRGVTVAGPLFPLLALPLKDLDTATIEAWAQREGQHRPTSARLAWRLLRAFLSWCAEHPDFKAIVPAQNPAKSRRAREALGKAGVKSDALLREQLPVWFAAVRAIGNAGISAYLQTLLLTGARPGELLGLRWEDLNVQWRGLTIRDKVEGERVIPLTPYVHHLLAGLPGRGRYVFSNTDKPLSYPQRQHGKACAVAGVQGLTLHGLRRSFKSLSEWLELPVGVIAQIQGHKPSATAEKHYTVRPLDLLRLHHEKFEAWILEQAGVTFDAAKEPGKLRAVGNVACQ